MTVQDALRGAGVPLADAEVLLSRLLSVTRADLLRGPERKLTNDAWTRWAEWVERRRKHEPVAYITGVQEFYGREFLVDRRVLIPRPATEGVVRAALGFLEGKVNEVEQVDEGIVVTTKWKMENGKWKIGTVIDIGTGSGCIGLTIAVERPDINVFLTDVSSDALDVARKNAQLLGVSDRVEFRQGNLFDPIADVTEPFLLVSNPPYIPAGRTLMEDVAGYEPHVALFGGTKGSELADVIRESAEKHPQCCGWVIEGPENVTS